MSIPFDSQAQIIGLRTTNYRSNGALAVVALVDYGIEEEGFEEVPVSVNLDHVNAGQTMKSRNLAEGEFFAKNYSEGERLYSALVSGGWIEPTGATARTGFVTVPACRLTDEGKKYCRPL